MQKPDMLHLHRIDPARNMARFYVLSVTPTLFGSAALVRHWGRMGTLGRTRIDLFVAHGDAEAELHRMARIKRRRGYVDVERESGM